MAEVCEVEQHDTTCGKPATRTLRLRVEPVGKGDVVFSEVVRTLCEGHAQAAQRLFGSPDAVDALLTASGDSVT